MTETEHPYLLMFTDENWGDNNNYYPTVFQFNCADTDYDKFVSNIADAINDVRDDDNNDDIAMLFESNTFDDIDVENVTASMIETVLRRNGNTIESLTNWLNGRKWQLGEIMITKDTDHVYDKMVRAGMPT